MTRACRRVAGACVWLAVLACVPASAQAAVVAGTSVKFPTAGVVGATGLPASITLRNANSDFEEIVRNAVCNPGENGLPCAMPEPGIVVVPACKQVAADRCTPAGADPGVFGVSPTAAGRLDSACAGMTFTTAIVDPVFGTVGFAPPAGARIVLAPGESCQIDFTVDVLKLPTGDVKPATSVTDTFAVTAHTQFAGALDPGTPSSEAGAVSTGTAVIRVPPTITATASPGITLGGQVSATATMTERAYPRAGATIDFRLYGRDDPHCTGAPVFESLRVPYPVGGDPVTSQEFTPVQSGVHRWVANYSGDTPNRPVSSFCAGAPVIVNPAPTPAAPPATTPTCSGKTATIVARPGKRSITGTAGADVIVGGLSGERINGGGGDDTICAGMGDDIVRGGAGNDTILGEGGQDRLFGDAGRDLLLGGAGNDDLRGGSGNDRVRTSAGGADRVDCGPGRGDRVLMDRLDRQTRCERVRRSR